MSRAIKHALCLNICSTTSTPISVYYHRKTLNAFCAHATGHNATKRERGPNLIASIESRYWEVSEEVLMHIYWGQEDLQVNTKVCGLEEEACTPVSCCGSALYLISLWERHTTALSLPTLSEFTISRFTGAWAGLVRATKRERERKRSMVSTKRHSSLWTERFRSW